MITKRQLEGYLMIDNRNSPGVPAEMIHQSGLTAPIAPAGKLYESGTSMCAHCGAIVVLNPNRTRERGYCARCDHYVCDSPACNKECVPIQRVFEDAYNLALRK